MLGGARTWLGITLSIVALDQLTKYLVRHTLNFGEPLAIAPLLNFMLMHNTGAAFSFLAGAGGWQRWLFITLAIAVSAYIIYLLNSLQTQGRLYRSGLTLVLAGAIGNLIDRIAFGYVIDFIQVYYATWYFPAFNIADSAITLGAGCLIASTFVSEGTSSAVGRSDRRV